MAQNYGYPEFREKVKEQMRTALSGWHLTDDEIEEYLKKEEQQIKDGYEEYLNPDPKDDRKDDARFASKVSTVAMCLEYCY